jgi:GT2 family glycosyltransferase
VTTSRSDPHPAGVATSILAASSREWYPPVDSPVRVLAVVVAHDAAGLLDDVLAALTAQTYDALEVIGVDNASTDGSGRILGAHLGEDRVLATGQDLGFTGAVSMALDSQLAVESGATWLLLVHDDLVLEPGAVAAMVEHAEADPRLGVVGPKLRSLESPRHLQQVGMSVDVTGRADSGIEPDELDQGQRDHVRPVLYVSTAGMFVRREVFDELGRFDPRYGVFREDLDVCWRVWLAGYDVEVCPDAVGYHLRASADDHRVGELGSVGRHYLAERNTLATLIKCYGAARLLLVLPSFFLVGAGRAARAPRPPPGGAAGGGGPPLRWLGGREGRRHGVFIGHWRAILEIQIWQGEPPFHANRH